MLLVIAYPSLKCSSSTQILIIYYSVGGSIAKVIVDYTGLAMQSLSIIAALIEAYRLLTKLKIFTSIPACCP
ncbi:hypothetical protein [Caldivirga sp. MU80]|uniref:hypothetical protein n=1 Tax=Caldivirga sp. MU80 TaxID=1650354 RepID=UPI0012E7C3D9|nr:hypothetical protein [Caldivirga sp. MU80]